MKYLFTIIDRFTRWPEAIPMAEATAESCARALLAHHIANFGVPTDISSDREAQFTSELWTALNKLLGARPHYTTSYHPQANGIIEHFHRQLKAVLKARLDGPHWTDELPLILLGIRSVPKDDLGCSTAELVYGDTAPTTAPTDGDSTGLLLRLRDTMQRLRATPTTHHGGQHTGHSPVSLRTCKFVFVRPDAHKTPLVSLPQPFSSVGASTQIFHASNKRPLCHRGR